MKTQTSHFPNLPQNLVLGIAVLEKCAKIKTALELRNKSIFLILMHQGAEISIPKSQSFLYVDKTDLTTILYSNPTLY